MGIYEQYKTDDELESKGIELDYNEAVITIARAGGANKNYPTVLNRLTAKHKRAIQTESLPDAVAANILRAAYAKAVILRWQTKTGEDETGERILEDGIQNPAGGDLLPFNEENVQAALRDLPDLFADIQEASRNSALFRTAVLEEDSKN